MSSCPTVGSHSFTYDGCIAYNVATDVVAVINLALCVPPAPYEQEQRHLNALSVV